MLNNTGVIPESWTQLCIGDTGDYKTWKSRTVRFFASKSARDSNRAAFAADAVMAPTLTSTTHGGIVKVTESLLEDDDTWNILKIKASSWIQKTDADDIVGKLCEKVKKPVIAVCDSNSFHNVSYLMACSALKRRDAKKKGKQFLVVNFDYHNDTGKEDEFVGSDTWGGKVKTYAKDLNYDYYYVGVGLAGGKQVQSLDPNRGKEMSSSATASEIFKAYSKVVKDLVDNKKLSLADAYVYVTIDRDVLKNNYTQWRTESELTWIELAFLLRNILAHLISAKARLVGFDATGLPTHSKACQTDKAHDPWGSTKFAHLKTELAIWVDLAGRALGLSLDPELRKTAAEWTYKTVQSDLNSVLTKFDVSEDEPVQPSSVPITKKTSLKQVKSSKAPVKRVLKKKAVATQKIKPPRPASPKPTRSSSKTAPKPIRNLSKSALKPTPLKKKAAKPETLEMMLRRLELLKKQMAETKSKITQNKLRYEISALELAIDVARSKG